MATINTKRSIPARRVSSIDVARAAGVSQATVSYVFNGRKGYVVPDLTRNRVLEAAAELGYTPNKNAQSLKTGKTRTIALWIMDVKTPIATEVLRRVVAYVEADNYEVIIGGSGQNTSTAYWPVDGVLAFDNRDELKFLMDQGLLPRVPTVSMGPYHFDQIDHVAVTLYPAARKAMNQIVAQGHKRIAYMSPTWSVVRGDERFDAYCDGLPLSQKPELIAATYNTRASARQDIKDYIADNGRPDCVVCYNDEIAVGTMRGLYDLSIRVPEEISVVGCDGISETIYHCPSISTIVQPLDEMCSVAWTFLFNRLNDNDLPAQKMTIPATYIDRESTNKKDPFHGSHSRN